MMLRPRPHDICARYHTGVDIFANCRSIVRFATVPPPPYALRSMPKSSFR